MANSNQHSIGMVIRAISIIGFSVCLFSVCCLFVCYIFSNFQMSISPLAILKWYSSMQMTAPHISRNKFKILYILQKTNYLKHINKLPNTFLNSTMGNIQHNNLYDMYNFMFMLNIIKILLCATPYNIFILMYTISFYNWYCSH